MPKKSRSSHVPQQITRKRRAPRRPTFQAEPETPVEYDTEEPVFADAPSFNVPGFSTGVVASTASRRRLEQLRRSVGDGTTLRVSTGQLPTYERSFLINEMRRIFITSGILLAFIVALSFIIR